MTHDPFGPSFWTVSFEAAHLAAALTDAWRPLREVVQSSARPVGRCRWERLVIFGLMEVDGGRRDGVHVRRGPEWQAWWAIHGREMSSDAMWEEFGAQFEPEWPSADG